MVYYTAVHFRCEAQLQFGHTLAVTGDHVSLGNWDTSKCHQLEQSNTLEVIWNSVVPAYLPLKEQRKYRYVVLDALGEFVSWKDEEERTLQPTGHEMIVEDDEGAYRKYCSSFSGLTQDSNDNENLPEGVKSSESLNVITMLNKLDVNPMHTVYFITTRLPIQVYRKPNGGFSIRHSNTPLTTTMWKVRNRLRNKMRFVGCCMIVSDSQNDNVGDDHPSQEGKETKTELRHELFTDEEKHQLRQLLWEHDCIPVFVPSEEQRMSMQFCKKYLWNLFYNIGLWDVNEQQEFDWDLWNAHLKVNRAYSDVVGEYSSEDDFFWVHDYKLLMVPHYITRRKIRSNIGLFMHAMFPPSSLFYCLAVRDMILRSMLCADLIGFQFFGYAHHFLSCCKQLLGVDHTTKPGGMLDIEYNGREIMILLSHSHIQPDLLAEEIGDKTEVPALVEDLRKQWPNRFIVASVDRDVRLAGLFLKFKAFRKYLRDYAYAREKILLIQYVTVTDTLWECRQDVVSTLKAMVASINEEFGSTHAILEFNVTQAKNYALLVAADCFLDTSIRGGINMKAMEYIYCRQGRPASAVLSEFVGFSKMLLSAKRVNPWHSESVMEALDAVMSSDQQYRMDVCKRDFEYISSSDTVDWVNHFIRELFCARKRQDMVHLSWGLGRTYRTYSVPSTFQKLDIEHVIKKYTRGKRRLLFLDCEGTLCPSIWETPPRSSQDFETSIRFQTTPLACNVTNIHKLAKDPFNVVVVISGQSRVRMEKDWFPGRKEIGLCAGYGLYYKVPPITGAEWKCMLDARNEDWRKPVLEIMDQYAHRTPGSYVENMENMVVFQFHHTDAEFGVTQSTELCAILKEIMTPYPVDVQCNKWNVHVRYKGINKGTALLNIVRKYSATHGNFDFILCIGDHKSDEDMFKALETLHDTVKEKMEPSAGVTVTEIDYISCTVGMKPTKAMYYVNNHCEVSDLLNRLSHY